jgi:FAD/FMN-containing dehydrogenase
MEEHSERVKNIAVRVRSFHERGEQFRIYHGSTNTTRKVKLSRSGVVDTSGMNRVLSVDGDKGVALVEPNVSMEQLVDATLACGFIPPVVMEFPNITVGGGFAGTAGESSSFRYGLFDRTIERIEIVLANGDIVEASKDERADLLDAAAGSFGTFGVITLLEIGLITAKPYVKLNFTHVGDMDDAVHVIENLTAEPETDYLEGIMFGLHSGLVISGKLTDDPDAKLPIERYTRAQDPWFYLRAQEIHDKELDDFQELVPIKDYLFRYDRGTFWAGMYAFKYFMTPFNSFTRWALDNMMRTKVVYHAVHKSRMADEYIVQDIGFPYATVGQFVEYVHRKFGFYPLWLCPLKMQKDMSLRPRRMAAFDASARSPGMMLNIGLWGPAPKPYDEWIKANREIEHKTTELGGLKCFYAQAFYTPDEFWSLYDKTWYDGMRAKYQATELTPVNEKINVDFSKRTPAHLQPWGEWIYEKFKEQWPIRGVYGVLHVLTNREYLLAK